MCLEKYLLSMYRRTFAKRLEPLSMKDDRTKAKKFAEVKEKNDKLKENPVLTTLSNAIKECDDDKQRLVDSTILRCHSSLSHAACSFRASPSVAVLADAVDSYHSMPLSMLEVMVLLEKEKKNIIFSFATEGGLLTLFQASDIVEWNW